MTQEDIITRMNSLEELPVSEETLGAYLEGNLTADEAEAVDAVITDYPELLDVDDDALTDDDALGLPDYGGMPEDFQLPEIPDGAMLDDTFAGTEEDADDLPDVEVDLTDDDITFQYHDVATMEEIPTYIDEEELDDIYEVEPGVAHPEGFDPGIDTTESGEFPFDDLDMGF